jgi:alkanesulfonate monooxygenase SsuD/methylene tetrahydromethanopterin reductase-like flavin-dependent oxidoreductase (luciferase family)
MHFGGAMFFTDYSMSAPELARALEERGFESVWAPEHSHIPLSRKTPFPGGGDLPKPYYDAMDPLLFWPQPPRLRKPSSLAPAWRSFSSATRSRPPSWSPRSTG